MAAFSTPIAKVVAFLGNRGPRRYSGLPWVGIRIIRPYGVTGE
jgi:hypothetical protein